MYSRPAGLFARRPRGYRGKTPLTETEGQMDNRPGTEGQMNNRALLVVDMQNGFCHPEGSFARLGMGLEGALAAVRQAAVAVAQARRAQVPVVFTRHLYRP